MKSIIRPPWRRPSVVGGGYFIMTDPATGRGQVFDRNRFIPNIPETYTGPGVNYIPLFHVLKNIISDRFWGGPSPRPAPA